MWTWLLSLLASLAADPAQIDQEAPRASAAVSAAYATTAQDKAPEPTPEPPKPKPGCCTECGGRGYITHGDGHRTACPCPASCRCKNPTGASSTTVPPSTPAGTR